MMTGGGLFNLFRQAPTPAPQEQNPLAAMLQYHAAINGLPDAVKNSILSAPSYGDGDHIPHMIPGGQPAADALSGEYDPAQSREAPMLEMMRRMLAYRR